MAALPGYAGKVLFASAVVAELNDWSVTTNRDTVETTKFGTAPVPKTFLTTCWDWTATVAGNLDLTDTNGQLVIFNAALLGTVLTPKFSINSGTNFFSGTAIVTAFTAKASVGGKVEFNASFKGDGATPLAYS